MDFSTYQANLHQIEWLPNTIILLKNNFCKYCQFMEAFFTCRYMFGKNKHKFHWASQYPTLIVKNIIELETHHPPMTYGDGDQGYRAGRAGDRPAAAAA